MLLRMYSVYDSKAVAFLQPFFSNSNGAAIRAFEDVVNDGKSPIAMHPGDYQLYELGGFNDENGVINTLSPNKLLCNGLDFVRVRVPDDAVKMSLDGKNWKDVVPGSEIAINGGSK